MGHKAMYDAVAVGDHFGPELRETKAEEIRRSALSRRPPRIRLFAAIERSDHRLREAEHLIAVVTTDEGEMSWLPTDWIGRGICFQQRRVFSLLDIDAAVVD